MSKSIERRLTVQMNDLPKEALIKRIADLEQKLFALQQVPRYKVSDLDDMMLPNPVPDGHWVLWSDIEKVIK